jgi:hypothetical protein
MQNIYRYKIHVKKSRRRRRIKAILVRRMSMLIKVSNGSYLNNNQIRTINNRNIVIRNNLIG